MSYDVSIYYRHTDHELFYGNMTRNVAGMWRHAGVDLRNWHDRSTSDGIVQELEKAIVAMGSDPETYRAMEPENKWGSYEGALQFLRDLLEACRTFTGERIQVSW